MKEKENDEPFGNETRGMWMTLDGKMDEGDELKGMYDVVDVKWINSGWTG